MRAFGLGGLALAIVVSFPAAAAPAPADPYHVTPKEKIACTQDAMRLCYGTYPDETKLLQCMRANVSQLTPMCKTAFVAGMKRRHIE